ncbi:MULTISPECIES: AAA family ATPase [unclassified Microcoleus]|uniref:McrB family protein n=1 Tax=unclassified Microcoleus TaxID=2642155 RepID=UPI002FD07353
MEKVFVHPECPFSVETFNLLAQFYAGKSPDFYMAHKKNCLKYVEDPLKYILSQVEEQLPDFMKKYLNIKHEIWAFDIETKYEQSPAYGLGLCFHESDDSSKLILLLQESRLIFGFHAADAFLSRMVINYQSHYRHDVGLLNFFKLYNLPNRHQYRLKYGGEAYHYNGWEEFDRTMKPNKSIYDLLESILEEITIDSIEEGMVSYDNILVALSLNNSEELLGYSAKQLIYKIAQAFKKLFPLLLISHCDNYDILLLVSQYFSVYEKEFNPVYELEEISQTTGFQTTQLTQWIHTINRKGQTIIQGPPGTGKTFLAQKLAQHLIGGGDGFSDTIQFHPAYTYEDFIQGLRPQSQDGQLTYPIVPGRFLEFCEKAAACEDICVLIIDEINRANLSQVFGELMYLLDDRQDTKRFITLASGQKFRIPTNVRIIGTMNTADRSIALVDQALRRRFAFIPLYPNYELLQNYHKREQTGFAVEKLIGILKNVNLAINNKHYELGISFFLTKTLGEDIPDIWQMEIESYLEEYFFDDVGKMDEFVWDKIKDKLSK